LEPPNAKKAIVLGATGATGSHVLSLLLNDKEYGQVHVFVRRKMAIQHEKLTTHIIDFDNSEQWRHLVTGDVLFSCLGTTRKAAGSKEQQYKVDYQYQYEFAQMAKENNITEYVLISAVNAHARSLFFYSRIKGQLEQAVLALGFSKCIIFRPPLLVRENSDRSLEVWAAKCIGAFNSLGLLLSQKPLPTKALAIAMLQASKMVPQREQIIQGQAISQYAQPH
jgi:uncharacterized protein YbjT (DUF2867 family)